MKKFGKFIVKNRVLVTLFVIIFICLVFALYFGIKLFWGDTSSNSYGTRLDVISDIKVDDSKVKEYLNKNENVSLVEVDTKGRIIYVMVELSKDIKVSEAKSLCKGSLTSFSDDVLKYYEIEYFVTKKDSKNYPIVGSKGKNKKAISWSRTNS